MGDAEEGTKYWQISQGTSWLSLMVDYRKRTPDKAIDLSDLKDAKLKFSIRLHRPLPAGGTTDQVYAQINDITQVEVHIELDQRYGFDNTSLEWQRIEIPVSTWAVDFSKIQDPFVIRASVINDPNRDPSVGRQLDFDIDHVRWER